MYSTCQSIIDLVPLLDNIDKNVIKSFITKAGYLVNSCINHLYKTPIRKKVNETGYITINMNSNVVIGYNTDFNNISEYSFIFLPKKNKTFRVLSVNDNNVLVVDEMPTISYINQEFFVLPDWLVMATEFITVNLLLNREFSRKGYNQEGIQKYKDDYNKLANEYLDKIKSGVYYDSSLEPVKYNNNLGRLVYIEDNTNKEIVDNISNEVKKYYD
jgi:hypothetical protein